MDSGGGSLPGAGAAAAAGGGAAAARALLRDAPDLTVLNVELPDSVGVLAAHDFSRLRAEKLGLHMPGTRGWVVAEAQAWLHDAAADYAAATDKCVALLPPGKADKRRLASFSFAGAALGATLPTIWTSRHLNACEDLCQVICNLFHDLLLGFL